MAHPHARPHPPPWPLSPSWRSPAAPRPTTTAARTPRRPTAPGDRDRRRADDRDVRPGATSRGSSTTTRRTARASSPPSRTRSPTQLGFDADGRRVGHRRRSTRSSRPAPRPSTSRSTRSRSATSARQNVDFSSPLLRRPRRPSSPSRARAAADATTLADLAGAADRRPGRHHEPDDRDRTSIDPDHRRAAVQRQRPGQAGADHRPRRRDRRRPADRAVHHGGRARRTACSSASCPPARAPDAVRSRARQGQRAHRRASPQAVDALRDGRHARRPRGASGSPTPPAPRSSSDRSARRTTRPWRHAAPDRRRSASWTAPAAQRARAGRPAVALALDASRCQHARRAVVGRRRVHPPGWPRVQAVVLRPRGGLGVAARRRSRACG